MYNNKPFHQEKWTQKEKFRMIDYDSNDESDSNGVICLEELLSF